MSFVKDFFNRLERLMQHDRALTPANQYEESLAQVGAIADTYSRQDVFGDYQERKPENTRRRQLTDLRLFANYLAEAGVQRDAEMLYSYPEAWRCSGVTGVCITLSSCLSSVPGQDMIKEGLLVNRQPRFAPQGVLHATLHAGLRFHVCEIAPHPMHE